MPILISFAFSRLSDDKALLDIQNPLVLAEVWLVDLLHKKLEIYRRPGPNGYRQIHIPESAERITPEHLPEAEIGDNFNGNSLSNRDISLYL